MQCMLKVCSYIYIHSRMGGVHLFLWLLTTSLLVSDGESIPKAASIETRAIVSFGRQPAQASRILWQKTASTYLWDNSQLHRQQWNPTRREFETVPDTAVPLVDWQKSDIRMVKSTKTPPSKLEVVAVTQKLLPVGQTLGLLSIYQPGITPQYVEEVLMTLKSNNIQTEVRGRDVVRVEDSTGRPNYGRMIPDGTIEWGLPEGRAFEYISSFEPDGIPTTKARMVSSGENYVEPITISNKKGLDQLRSKVSQSTLAFEDASTNTKQYLSEDDVFGALTEGTRSLFSQVDIPSDWGDRGSDREVRFKDGTTKTVKVREFNNQNDLLTEIKYWGDMGFPYPINKKRPREYEDTFKYLRYGDWVLSMKVESKTNIYWSINPFYIELKGIIHAEDPENPVIKNENFDFSELGKSTAYRNIQRHTDELFFNDVIDFYTGTSKSIPADSASAIASAYNAQVGSAMFLAEPIRDWRTFVTNRMALDKFLHGQLGRNEFFKTHPMARGGAGPAKFSGLRESIYGGAGSLPRFSLVKSLFADGMLAWYARYKNGNWEGKAVNKDDYNSNLDENLSPLLIDSMKQLIDTNPAEKSSFYNHPPPENPCLKRATGGCTLSDNLSEPPWDARPVESPEIDTAQSQFDGFTSSEEHSLPYRTSMALLTDQITISKNIARTVMEREEVTGKAYQVDEESIRVEDGKISFHLIDVEDPTVTESVEEEFDESKLASKQILDETETKVMRMSNEPEEGASGSVGRVLGIYGTLLGFQGTVESFERGDYTNGAINLAMTLHGIGELSGVNRIVYKAAGRVLGAVVRGSVNRIASAIESTVGEDAARAVLSGSEELLSLGSRVGELAKDIPIIGTAFGIYNIANDLKQGTPIGYVDAGLDTLITVVGLLGPEAEPLVIALTVIRMTIDTFYYDVKQELDSLPPGASTGDKILAVLKGVLEALGDILDTVTGGIFTFDSKSHKLDEQYHNNQAFLRELADYNNYFSVSKEEGDGSTAINFAGGSESWNGGDIVFVLKDDGTGDLTMTLTNTQGQEVKHEESIAFDPNANDIVMGIGESHTVNFRIESVKVLWFIPVDKKRIISGLNGDGSTLHGSYTGNSRSNNFFAVQNLPPDSGLMYKLEDYSYHLFGGDGDDSFYIGPQNTLAEGGQGEDVYFVNFTNTLVTINNHASDHKDDYVIIQHSYDDLTVTRSGADVVITSNAIPRFLLFNYHATAAPKQAKLQNWYTSSAYQHMTIRTEDGVLFRLTVDELGEAHPMPFALTAAGSPVGRTLDANITKFSTVKVLIGSDHDDTLIGNAGANTLIGGAGEDLLTGGPGQDTYNIKDDSSTDTINNYAEDRQPDSLLFHDLFTDITASRQGQDLMLTSPTVYVVLLNWFLGEDYQHCVFVSQDFILFEVNSTDLSTIPIILELSQPSTVDLRSSSVLSKVPSVIGSDGDDSIIGNNRSNYLMGGAGNDFLQGGEGSDVYVIHPNQGHDSISNLAADQQQDLLLFGTNYTDIRILSNIDENDLSMVSSQNMSVTLVSWFSSNMSQYRHLTVRSVDGVEFLLPENKTTMKIPVAIDTAGSNQSLVVDLSNSEWSSVQRVIGSQSTDIITGNNLSNYLDPSVGEGAVLRGNNGSDTYVVKAGYGDVTVYNEAEDGLTDALLFLYPLHSITVKQSGPSLVLSTVDPSNGTSVTLVDYLSYNSSRHLIVTTSDGFTCTLPPSNNFQLLPIIINRYKDNTGQYINLTHGSLSSVITVYGAQRYRNHIYGNSLNNTLVGGDGNDCIDGGEGDDVLKGGKGADRITGGEGQDTLVGGSENDTLDGGPGNDILAPGPGSNTVIGGNGTDTVLYDGDPFNNAGVIVDLYNGLGHHTSGVDSLEGVENVIGTPFADTLIASSFDDNVLSGQGGDDHLIAYSAYNILIGGEGQDTYNLTFALGTKVIVNFARDQQMDRVDISFVDSGDLRYQISGDDLIIRKVSNQYKSPLLLKDVCNVVGTSVDIYPVDATGSPINSSTELYPSVGFCEAYDTLFPTVVLKDWFKGEQYQHLVIDTKDCVLDLDYLKSQPTPVYCHLVGRCLEVTFDQTNRSHYKENYPDCPGALSQEQLTTTLAVIIAAVPLAVVLLALIGIGAVVGCCVVKLRRSQKLGLDPEPTEFKKERSPSTDVVVNANIRFEDKVTEEGAPLSLSVKMSELPKDD